MFICTSVHVCMHHKYDIYNTTTTRCIFTKLIVLVHFGSENEQPDFGINRSKFNQGDGVITFPGNGTFMAEACST